MKTQLLIAFLILSLTSFDSEALDDPFLQDIQIRQQLIQQQQDIERTRKSQEIKRVREKSQDVKIDLKQKDFFDDGFCAKIDQFVILGNNALKIDKFADPQIGRCLTKTDLKNIKDSIENYYIEKGYFLARVYFDTKRMGLGIVEIVIEEGILSDLKIEDNSIINKKFSWRRKLQKFFAFGFYKNKTVNLRDIEQGLDQINRLSSNYAQMELEPANQDGYSDITIKNQIGFLTKPSIEINNSGNENTGRIKHNFILNQDNLLGINDNIYFSHSKTDYDGVNKRYSKSNYLSFSAPFSYYTFGGSYSDSDYLITTPGILSNQVSAGSSKSISYYVSKVLIRDQKYKISAKAQMSNASNKSFSDGVFLKISSRELAVAKLSFDNVFYTKTGSIFLQPKYNRGTRMMGSDADEVGLTKNAEKLQFQSYGIYGSMNNKFPLPKTSFNFSHNISFDAQYSKDRLFASEQIAIGGRYNVRGFEESSISGDNGYYIKNDLTANLLQFMPQKINNPAARKLAQRLSASIFYDYGYVRNKIINDQRDEGYMSGTGVKLSYSGQFLTAGLTYSKGLHSPQFLRNIDKITKDGESIYFDVKFGLF
ncbi:MAG: hemolysin activation/secretion protein [Rickettsiales bacterium]|jgi:hemolysin activation/secretion protein